jgi:hypothetical protein
MTSRIHSIGKIFLIGFWAMIPSLLLGAEVEIIKAPNGGLQPQAIVDSKGILHLVYFKGTPGGGDLYYVRKEAKQSKFSDPIRVNTQSESAVAVGTVRGGQLAIGKENRVHIVWNGSQKVNGKNGSPLLYTRLNETGTGFEKERDLLGNTKLLDGGCSVGADREGNVYVTWHAQKIGGEKGEENRQVWIARSEDSGKTFTPEKQANVDATGVCGCCALRSFVDTKGALYILYRSARNENERDMYLLVSQDHGKSFQSTLLQKWRINGCPMSTMAFAQSGDRIWMGWETEEQIYFASVKTGSIELTKPQNAPGAIKGRKHPSLTVNDRGETLLVWAEGAGWQKGGSLCWQVYDSKGQPTSEKGSREKGIPVWGIASAVVFDGKFTIIH